MNPGDRFVAQGVECEVVWSGGPLHSPETPSYGPSSLTEGIVRYGALNTRGSLTSRSQHAPRQSVSDGNIFGFRGWVA